MDAKKTKHPITPDTCGQAPKTTSVAIGHTPAEGTSITVTVPPGGWKAIRDASRAVAWTLFGVAVWLVAR